MSLLNPGEPLANKRRGLSIRGLAPVGEIFSSVTLSLHSISSVSLSCTFPHVTFRENTEKLVRNPQSQNTFEKDNYSTS